MGVYKAEFSKLSPERKRIEKEQHARSTRLIYSLLTELDKQQSNTNNLNGQTLAPKQITDNGAGSDLVDWSKWDDLRF